MKKRYLFYTIQYGSIGGGVWLFRWPGNQSKFVRCKSLEVAEAVARIIAGALKRNDNQLDNLARKNIDQVIERASQIN